MLPVFLLCVIVSVGGDEKQEGRPQNGKEGRGDGEKVKGIYRY